MNSVTRTPRPSRAGWLFQLRRIVALSTVHDSEFQAAALEVLEKPPSPVKMVLMSLICALLTVVILTACIFRVDIYAQAKGRVEASGRSKVVQPFDLGRVANLYVQNGDRVRKNDPLLELDPSEAEADREEVGLQLAGYQAEIERRIAAVRLARGSLNAEVAPLSWPPGIPIGIQQREQRVLVADISQLRSDLSVVNSDIRKSRIELEGLRALIASQKDLLNTLSKRVDMRESLERDQWESRANVMDAQESLYRERETQVDREGQTQQITSEIHGYESQRAQKLAKFIDDNAQALEIAEGKRDSATLDLVKAKVKSERTRILAPVDGTIQELAVTGVGQIVTSAQQLLTVVPESNAVQVEALVSSEDIGFVQANQRAVIKVDTFPYSIYGTLAGHVANVSRDAVDGDNWQESIPTADDTATPITSSATDATKTPHTRNLVFPIAVALDSSSVSVDGRQVALSPGMTVTVEVVTGHRRIIDYLLSPLREVTANAIKER